jgi:hypothetical protein
MQYMGDIYSLDSEYGIEKLTHYKNKTCTYLMSLHKNEVIDPTEKGNPARFINHSCDPNCETQKWKVQGEVCVGIFTLKDIQEDEELTFNYGFDVLKTTFQKCLCKSTNCRGYLGIVQSHNGRIRNKINCDQCKNQIKSSKEILIVCDTCNKIVHKKCVNIKKAKLTEDNFVCQKCIKAKMKKDTPKEDKYKKEKKVSLSSKELLPSNDEKINKDTPKLNLGKKAIKNISEVITSLPNSQLTMKNLQDQIEENKAKELKLKDETLSPSQTINLNMNMDIDIDIDMDQDVTTEVKEDKDNIILTDTFDDPENEILKDKSYKSDNNEMNEENNYVESSEEEYEGDDDDIQMDESKDQLSNNEYTIDSKSVVVSKYFL